MYGAESEIGSVPFCMNKRCELIYAVFQERLVLNLLILKIKIDDWFFLSHCVE